MEGEEEERGIEMMNPIPSADMTNKRAKMAVREKDRIGWRNQEKERAITELERIDFEKTLPESGKASLKQKRLDDQIREQIDHPKFGQTPVKKPSEKELRDLLKTITVEEGEEATARGRRTRKSKIYKKSLGEKRSRKSRKTRKSRRTRRTRKTRRSKRTRRTRRK